MPTNQVVIEKNKQAKLLKEQIQLVLRSYNISSDELEKAAKDISDVVLTSWDLSLSNMNYAGTWFDPTNLSQNVNEE